jgi:hypothetical protein
MNPSQHPEYEHYQWLMVQPEPKQEEHDVPENDV